MYFKSSEMVDIKSEHKTIKTSNYFFDSYAQFKKMQKI